MTKMLSINIFFALYQENEIVDKKITDTTSNFAPREKSERKCRTNYADYSALGLHITPTSTVEWQNKTQRKRFDTFI
jgi:hypothetical protein